ncbi:hypothetical protein Kpol_184p2 [Vanderwaltozyma polyspora DSM 70294]|uniref:Uncharacterized protein n=1 Tax=Vanderwaltozyma polyspora (strain ATCC 22028 / DSM 70294 / BCRC 21397 / CBS 2163 / NBRC 10782 / NRRL Y-8283 / UCD 57-17) TaxID=436907 RepID=A7TTR6_VANPO|nr:uncharacterized protein Kpol_184p2 [Vanderwaltozyma polyspora DSM 70294]EDO14342.1 hypothetical protein Kpol_184p2 [Vanderwaltozyma polyspora DSM 70294]
MSAALNLKSSVKETNNNAISYSNNISRYEWGKKCLQRNTACKKRKRDATQGVENLNLRTNENTNPDKTIMKYYINQGKIFLNTKRNLEYVMINHKDKYNVRNGLNEIKPYEDIKETINNDSNLILDVESSLSTSCCSISTKLSDFSLLGNRRVFSNQYDIFSPQISEERKNTLGKKRFQKQISVNEIKKNSILSQDNIKFCDKNSIDGIHDTAENIGASTTKYLFSQCNFNNINNDINSLKYPDCDIQSLLQYIDYTSKMHHEDDSKFLESISKFQSSSINRIWEPDEIESNCIRAVSSRKRDIIRNNEKDQYIDNVPMPKDDPEIITITSTNYKSEKKYKFSFWNKQSAKWCLNFRPHKAGSTDNDNKDKLTIVSFKKHSEENKVQEDKYFHLKNVLILKKRLRSILPNCLRLVKDFDCDSKTFRFYQEQLVYTKLISQELLLPKERENCFKTVLKSLIPRSNKISKKNNRIDEIIEEALISEGDWKPNFVGKRKVPRRHIIRVWNNKQFEEMVIKDYIYKECAPNGFEYIRRKKAKQIMENYIYQTCAPEEFYKMYKNIQRGSTKHKISNKNLPDIIESMTVNDVKELYPDLYYHVEHMISIYKNNYIL